MHRPSDRNSARFATRMRKPSDTVRQFFEDSSRECEDYGRNVFIMTRFQVSNRTLSELDEAIRETLHSHSFVLAYSAGL